MRHPWRILWPGAATATLLAGPVSARRTATDQVLSPEDPQGPGMPVQVMLSGSCDIDGEKCSSAKGSPSLGNSVSIEAENDPLPTDYGLKFVSAGQSHAVEFFVYAFAHRASLAIKDGVFVPLAPDLVSPILEPANWTLTLAGFGPARPHHGG